ncbi:hypothetical protein ADUPG1_012584 [Aduncisulcus paluster]|uniref:Uncharacterized protein n=1 Tax=Aduncisulcus paluster TaxID=2918883 RepID=A0ABQ5K4R0_9EUKA|nr:hypothetical protein ADUPG1_012584 [Aduncisulcus paluster]
MESNPPISDLETFKTIKRNVKLVLKATKRRYSELKEMISSSLPPIISGETSVTSTNIEAFLDTSKVYAAAIEFLSKKIAVRLLAALCHYEYEKKIVKTNRRLPEADRKDIILEEIRTMENLYLAIHTNNYLSNIKKHRTTLKAMIDDCNDAFHERFIDTSILTHYVPTSWKSIVSEQSIPDISTPSGASLTLISQGSELSSTMQTSSVAVDLDEEEEFEELE